MSGQQPRHPGQQPPHPSLPPSFFDRPHLEVARDLLGTTLVWDGCGGVIVETEGYAAEGDPACHTATRPSARAFFERHPPGTAYVYINYGIHWLLNVLAADGIVLLRALEPTLGIPRMRRRRRRDPLTDLCSGPGKLGAAIALARNDHGTTLTGHPHRSIVPRPAGPAPAIVATPRIGISQATHLPWRFHVAHNPHVSRRGPGKPQPSP